jgi:hypothetical protein
LLKQNECISYNSWGNYCPYARMSREDTMTMRAKSYRSQVNAFKQERDEFRKNYPVIARSNKNLFVVGEWIYLGYRSMGECQGVPFRKKTSSFDYTNNWIKAVDFDVNVIDKLFNKRNYVRNSFGEYWTKTIPEFLYDLKHFSPGLYDHAAILRPDIIRATPNLESFKDTPIRLSKIPAGSKVRIREDGKDYEFEWDGERLSCDEASVKLVRSLMWGQPDKPISISFTPKDDMEILATDEIIHDLYESGAYS